MEAETVTTYGTACAVCFPLHYLTLYVLQYSQGMNEDLSRNDECVESKTTVNYCRHSSTQAR